jgi:hypothetical protein
MSRQASGVISEKSVEFRQNLVGSLNEPEVDGVTLNLYFRPTSTFMSFFRICFSS